MSDVLTFPDRTSPDARRIIAPYIVSWSTEQELPYQVIEHPGRGIAYSDETVVDRDRKGVLWRRMTSQPGQGRPQFGEVHPLRQRRAMLRMLCQVCAGPAGRMDDDILWLLKDHRDDWPSWPENMGVTEPPVCLPCLHTSLRLCPALRKGAAAVRVRRFPLAGVRGALYQSGRPSPVVTGDVDIAFEDPAIHWVRATNLLRELRDCTILPLEKL